MHADGTSDTDYGPQQAVFADDGCSSMESFTLGVATARLRHRTHAHTRKAPASAAPPPLLPVVVKAKQGPDADVINAAPECPVLRQQPVVIVTLWPADVHLLEGGPVVRLLEQREGADLMTRMHKSHQGSNGRTHTEATMAIRVRRARRHLITVTTAARRHVPTISCCSDSQLAAEHSCCCCCCWVTHAVCGLEAPHV